jgi:hypothetical protein
MPQRTVGARAEIQAATIPDKRQKLAAYRKFIGICSKYVNKTTTI